MWEERGLREYSRGLVWEERGLREYSREPVCEEIGLREFSRGLSWEMTEVKVQSLQALLLCDDHNSKSVDESPWGCRAGSGIYHLLALKPHWLKAPVSLAEFFTFKKREEVSIGEGLT